MRCVTDEIDIIGGYNTDSDDYSSGESGESLGSDGYGRLKSRGSSTLHDSGVSVDHWSPANHDLWYPPPSPPPPALCKRPHLSPLSFLWPRDRAPVLPVVAQALMAVTSCHGPDTGSIEALTSPIRDLCLWVCGRSSSAASVDITDNFQGRTLYPVTLSLVSI